MAGEWSIADPAATAISSLVPANMDIVKQTIRIAVPMNKNHLDNSERQ